MNLRPLADILNNATHCVVELTLNVKNHYYITWLACARYARFAGYWGSIGRSNVYVNADRIKGSIV